MSCRTLLLVSFVLASFLCLNLPSAVADSTDRVHTRTAGWVQVQLEKKGAEYSVHGIHAFNGEFPYFTAHSDELRRAHYGRVVSVTGDILGYFPAGNMVIVLCWDGIDPETKQPTGGCSEVDSGPISLNMPFFPTAKSAEIFNPRTEEVLAIDLLSVGICKEDGTCKADRLAATMAGDVRTNWTKDGAKQMFK